MSSPQPVILCGKTEQIATGVIANLKPEFEGKPRRRRRTVPVHGH